MFTEQLPAQWSGFWKHITCPAEAIQHEDQRHQASLLASLLLALLLAVTFVFPIWMLTASDFAAVPYISAVVYALLLACYGISRTRHYVLGAYLVVSILFLLITAVIFTAPGSMVERMLSLNFLVMAVLLATLLLNLRALLLVVVVSIVAVVPFFYFPGVPFAAAFTYLVYVTVMSLLCIVTAVIRDNHVLRLSHSQQQLDAFFTQSLDGFFFMTLDTPVVWNDSVDKNAVMNEVFAHQRVTRVNQAMLTQYRASAEQFLGLTPNDFFAHDLAQGKAVWRQFFDSGHLHVETDERRFDGTQILIEGDYVCFYDSAGRITGHFGVQRDVTERKRTELALRESEQRFRALFEQTPDAIFVIGMDGRYQAANHQAADMLGYSLDEMQTLAVRDVSAEMDKSDAILARMLGGENIPLYERLFRKKNGDLIPVEINVELIRDVNGTPTHIQSIVRDISERKIAEEALRISEERQRALLRAMPDLMFRNHRDGTYLDYYAARTDKLAVPPERFMYRKVFEVLPPEIAALSMDCIERALRTGEEVAYEYSLPSGDQVMTFEARMVMCAPDEVLTIVRDITAQKQAQAQALALVVERERVKVLSLFVQHASHELRTPLAVINSSIYLMTHIDDENKRQHYGKQAEDHVRQLTRLLDMILAMTKLDAGAAFQFQASQINNILRQVIDSRKQAHKAKTPVVQFYPDPALSHFEVDLNWLSQALEELVDNAIRFTPDGGAVTIRTYCRASQCVIEIRDTGIGICKEALPHIFERFWRHDGAHTTPGFGLGLPIAQKIIERHQGTILVESTAGAGSVFTIVLPTAPHDSSMLN